MFWHDLFDRLCIPVSSLSRAAVRLYGMRAVLLLDSPHDI